MAPRTRRQAQDDPIDSMVDASPKKTTPSRKRSRKDPSKKSEEFDTPLPSVEDEQSAPTFTQVSDNAPIGARTRSRSASVNPTTARTQRGSRSTTPATKTAGTSTTKRGKKRKQTEEDGEEESATVQRNKKARGNDYDDEPTGEQSTHSSHGGRGGRGRGRSGRGRGGRVAGSLQAIEESPAKQDDLTAILSAHPTQPTPSRMESKVDASTTPTPSVTLQLPSGSGKSVSPAPIEPQLIQSSLHEEGAPTTPSAFASLQVPSGSAKYVTSPTPRAELEVTQSPLHEEITPTTPSAVASSQVPSGSGEPITSPTPRAELEPTQSPRHEVDAPTTPIVFASLQEPSGSSKDITSPEPRTEPRSNYSPLHKVDASTAPSPFASLQLPTGSGKHITSSTPRAEPESTQSTPHKVDVPPTPSPFATLQPPSSSGKYVFSTPRAEPETQSPHKFAGQSESDTHNTIAPAALSSFGSNSVLRRRDGPSPSHASILKSLKRSTSKRTRFEPYPMRQASPEKDYAYESLSESEVTEFKPGTAEWRDTKIRWKAVDKFLKSGDAKHLLKGVSNDASKSKSQREPSNKTSAQRISMHNLLSTNPQSLVFPPVNSSIPELRITDATLIEKLRAVAEWATSDASNTLPTVDEIKSLLEQAKSQVSATIESPQPDVENAQSSRIPTTPTRNVITVPHQHPSGCCNCYDDLPENERPGRTFNVPFTPTDEEVSDDESDMSTVVADRNTDDVFSDEGSILQNHTPIPSTTMNSQPVPHLLPKVPESKEPQGWFGSAKKALHSTFSFFGHSHPNRDGINEGYDNTAEQEFTFTSSQKLPNTTTPSKHGGRASRKAPQTERPPRINPALIPPEKFVPGSARPATKEKVPLHMRNVQKSPGEQRSQGTSSREMVDAQEKQRQKQRETQEAAVADEVHETRKQPLGDYYFDPEEYSSESESDPDEIVKDPDEIVEFSEEWYDKLFREGKPEAPYNIECPPEPMRNWQLDDEYGFTFKQYRRYPKLTHNPPNNPKYVFWDPPQVWWKSSTVPRTPNLVEWMNEHKAWKKLCWAIKDKKATQEEVDEFNAMIKRNEERRAAEAAAVAAESGPSTSSAAESASDVTSTSAPTATADSTPATSAPPPTPRPANAALPSTVVAKATPYAPKTPSRLRTAERAYSSSPVVIDEEVEHVPTALEAGGSILRETENRNEIFHPFSVWDFGVKDVGSNPDWLH